jgi:nucleoside-diphosphate-sugar epimerase
MKRLIFGCGYLGERVAQRWAAAGDDVVVVTRSDSRAREFESQGFTAFVADVTQPETLRRLPAADTVLYAVGFDRTAGPNIDQVYAGGMRNVLSALPPRTGRLIYISTTGVYGSAGGDWIDEQTPPDPQRDGGKASLAAEEALRAHSWGSNSVILRLAGIYGPDRIPFIKDLHAGTPIAAPREGYLNLIHVDDAASVVAAAANLVTFTVGPRVYCVSDGQPVVRGDFYREVARLAGSPPPQFVEPDPNSPRALRAGANRRVRNERMLRELGVELVYPDHRAGLEAILNS